MNEQKDFLSLIIRLNLLGNDRYIYEVEMAVKLIESYMPERYDMAIDLFS